MLLAVATTEATIRHERSTTRHHWKKEVMNDGCKEESCEEAGCQEGRQEVLEEEVVRTSSIVL
jgi:hypothetical protein